MNESIIITGTNRGLGYHLVNNILKFAPDKEIFSVSRKISKEQSELLESKSNKFYHIEFDFNDKNFFKMINEVEQHINRKKKIIFINNAATIQPLGKIGNFDFDTISKSIYVNCTLPIKIINYLFNKFNDRELTIIHISSGAYVRPIENWSIYCSSKAMIEMYINNLKLENENKNNIKIYSIDPGKIKTDMQFEISKFLNNINNNDLKDPNIVAYDILKSIGLI